MVKNIQETGTCENMTDVEAEKLKQYKSEMKDLLFDYPDLNTKWSLLRFLRARNFNIEKAKNMLTNAIKFRQENDYARAMSHDFSEFEFIFKNYSYGFCNYDNEGRVIVVEEIAKSRPQEILKNVSEELLTDYLIQKHERLIHVILPALSRFYGRRIDRTCLIIDLKDVSIGKWFDSKLQKFLKLASVLGQDYYPELLGISFIINAPFIFKGLWAVIKTMLDERTVKKFFIESNDGLKTMKNYMNVDFLPISMGGKSIERVDEFNGPWKDELLESWKDKKFWPKDRSSEYKYFYDENDRRTSEETVSQENINEDKSRENVELDAELSKFLFEAQTKINVRNKTLVSTSELRVLKMERIFQTKKHGEI